MLRMVETIGEAEKASVKGKPEHSILGDFMARVSRLKPEFFSHAYYPIGGITTLIKMSSLEQHRKHLSKSSHDLHFFIELMRIFHFWHENLNDLNLYAKPSLYNSCRLIGSVRKWPGKRAPGTRLRLELTRYMNRAALIYSASKIKIDGEKNLLETMQRHELSFESLKPNLERWISLARFVADHILKNVATADKLANNRSYSPHKTNAETLPSISAEAFTIDPPFAPEAIKKLQASFPFQAAGRKRT